MLLQVSYVKKHTPLPHVMKYAGSASADNAVYIVGGNTYPHTLAYRYDFTVNTWQDLGKLITERPNYPCVFLLGNKLCAVGGQHNGVYLSSMECLDIKNNTATWQRSKPFSYPVAYTSCVTVGGSVILTGGKTDFVEALNKVKKLTENGNWTSLAGMQNSRRQHCTVTDGSRYVYVVSGYRTKSMERYDIQNNNWKNMAPLSQYRYRHACVYMNSTIVVTGGYNMKTIELYSVNSNTWTESSITLPKKLFGHTMAVLSQLTPN